MYAILGCGSVGFQLAIKLRKLGREFLIFENNPSRIQSLAEQGFEAIEEDIRKIDPLKHRLDKCDVIFVIPSNLKTITETIINLNKKIPQVPIVTRVKDMNSQNKIKDLGPYKIVMVSDSISDALMNYANILSRNKKMDKFKKIIKESSNGISIVIHNNPDPDAIASAMAMKKICEVFDVDATIYYGGRITHQENRVFVNILNVEMERVENDRIMEIINSHSTLILLDSNMSGSNNLIPNKIIPNIIIDHHQITDDASADYSDIRPNIGATSTIMTEYIQELGIIPDKNLATALVYGIRTDTKNLSRGVSPSDFNTISFLSAYIDPDIMEKLDNPPKSLETLDIIGKTLINRDVYSPYAISNAGYINEPDALAQSAELLLTLEGVQTVLVFGIYNDMVHLSARTVDARVNIGEVLKEAFGSPYAGGHSRMGGGQIPLGLFSTLGKKKEFINLLSDAVRDKFFSVLGVTSSKQNKDDEEKEE